MKKTLNFYTLIFIIAVFAIVNVPKTFAISPTIKPGQQIREELKEKTATRENLLKKITSARTKAVIINGTLSGKDDTTLTITKDDKTYKILTDNKTQLRRKFWGKATLDEMQDGDMLTVYGKWTDETQTTIQARLVRDSSVQKRNGVFFGTVQTLTDSGWVMQTVVRGAQTVTVSKTTKFINRKGQTIAQTNIKVTDKVRVRGLWDNKNNTITAVVQVKDFSIPAQTTPTPKLKITPTLTPTPTI